METTNFIPARPLTHQHLLPKVTIGPKERLPRNVKLHRDGDTITAIEVRCSCGEAILIECEYD